VDDDEQHLVVLAGARMLSGQDLVEAQVVAVGEAFRLSLVNRHHITRGPLAHGLAFAFARQGASSR